METKIKQMNIDVDKVLLELNEKNTSFDFDSWIEKVLYELQGERGKKNFKEDVDRIGNLGELLFSIILVKKGFRNIKRNPKGERAEMAKWDIEVWFDDKRYTFEIKTDAKAADTGNLCIEESKKDKQGNHYPSGISSTTANFFVSIIPDKREVRIAYSNVLKNVIEENKNSLKIYPMGDGARTMGYLMKIKTYEKYYRSIIHV